MAKNEKIKTADVAVIAMFTVIITACSWISVPSAVPFTLQTFGIFLTIYTLGGKKGFLAVLTYFILGIIGVPVFSGFSGGVGYLFGSTGGYLFGFLLSCLLMWAFECFFKKKTWVKVLSSVFALCLCYTIGTLWFINVYTKDNTKTGLISAFTLCVLPYIIPDALKIILAFYVSKRLQKINRL